MDQSYSGFVSKYRLRKRCSNALQEQIVVRGSVRSRARISRGASGDEYRGPFCVLLALLVRKVGYLDRAQHGGEVVEAR